MRFPENYDASKKYPIIVFLHGAGEVADASNSRNAFYANRENQYQLYHGAEIFSQRMDQGEWNGFMLFSQLLSTSPQWETDAFVALNNIMDTLTKYNGLDQDRVTTIGLSAGGVGAIKYGYFFPGRIATAISANPRFIETIMTKEYIDSLQHIPIWMAVGGEDKFPGPTQTTQFRDSVALRGGNIFYTYHPTTGHSSWYPQWNQYDANFKHMLTDYLDSAHKAQPLVYFQNTQFCSGSPISAKMAITAFYNAYEWQYDNGSGSFATIPGATLNTYTATQVGRYRVRFQRVAAGAWSAWTPYPIVISTKACAIDTVFAEHFDAIPVAYSQQSPNGNNSAYFPNNYTCQNGVFVNGTEGFTQDAAGRQGGRFMLNNTMVNDASHPCIYFSGDQIWRTVNPVTVLPNTNYAFNFYIGNRTGTGNLAQLSARINTTDLTPVNVGTVLSGNVSWKKYTFVWNSGGSTTAQLAITTNITTGTDNDFVVDEISLVKYMPVMPGGVNSNLWAKANTVPGIDGSLVGLWPNSDINSNNLQQNTLGAEPVLRNNAADNINFNPIVNYTSATNKSNFVTGGFAGNTVHNAAHVYLVTKANSIANGQVIMYEGLGAGTLSIETSSGGRLAWTAGTLSNSITTPTNANELNKPILWTFSKDNINNTGDGNKQDIRKNGIAVASSANTTTFTGNNSNLSLGRSTSASFNGNIAEIIYLLDATINAATQNKIESYLAVKYGTTLGYRANPVSYTSSDGTVIWPASATFQADVFGIGTDSLSGLVQKKSNSVNSGSGDGTGQSLRGNLVLATNTNLLDKRFLMIGHDSAALTQTVIPAGQAPIIAVGSTRLNREWKVVNTGGVGAVDLSFDTTGMANQAGGSIVNNYALMIDNDGDGNFSTGTVTFFNATSASGKKINFSGVTLNNNVAFTILTLKSSNLLPAIWLGFTAEAVNGNALLNWKTSDEMNVERYAVEHSFNGVSFSIVGSVNANNNSGENKYTFTHNGLAAGVHYYRIRRIDKDGNSGYSDVKTVRITTNGANVQIRPNPVMGATLVLAVSVQQSSKTMVQVMGADGKVILQKNISLFAGNNLVNLDVANVPTGIYMVQLLLSDEVVTKKFIRQR
ncbi:MAG: T9SS type A sorting domain-containing protein [Chitinophagaceae bacterium]